MQKVNKFRFYIYSKNRWNLTLKETAAAMFVCTRIRERAQSR